MPARLQLCLYVEQLNNEGKVVFRLEPLFSGRLCVFLYLLLSVFLSETGLMRRARTIFSHGSQTKCTNVLCTCSLKENMTCDKSYCTDAYMSLHTALFHCCLLVWVALF